MPSGERYKPEDIRMALAIHAMSSGVEKEVRVELAAAGLGHINFATLRGWVSKSRKDEYAQIHQELDAVFMRESIDKWRGQFKIAGAVATEAMRQAHEALKRGEIDVKDLTKTAKDAGVVAAVATDKIELLSGRPTDRHAGVGLQDLIGEAASVGITVIFPGMPEAEKKPEAIDVRAKPTAELPAGA